ncbi:MAG: type II toxin-antitoxin system RelE/ParE family toxin [Caulobacteraceae bacterium]
MRLRYTLRAAAELDEVLAHIAQRSPRGALHVKARIQATLDLLSLHPGAGQLTSKGRLRRVVVHPYPYLIFYNATEDEVVIHGVRHGARRPSSMPELKTE